MIVGFVWADVCRHDDDSTGLDEDRRSWAEDRGRVGSVLG
jgi:hypothetical protein